MAAIYEVLKDKERRAMYDRVLVEGLPDWRMPVYYFRRMRKIGLAEGLAYLLGIIKYTLFIIIFFLVLKLVEIVFVKLFSSKYQKKKH